VSTIDFAAVGDVMLDVLAPPLRKRPVHAAIEVRAGGSAVNAARAAAAAGRPAVVIGCIGDDLVGELLRGELADAGIDGLLGTVRGARTGRAVYAGGFVAAERGANARFAPEHVPRDLSTAAVLVSGYQLLRDDSGPGAAAAFALGGVVGVDLGTAGLVRAFGSARLRALLGRVDVIFGDDDAIKALGELQGPLVVTTLGPDGAHAAGVHVRPETVLDAAPVGAGDALAAAFLLALAEGDPVDEALERGCAAGTAVAVESQVVVESDR
jgi:sugar/nucleoside kinase (ribokinase family)